MMNIKRILTCLLLLIIDVLLCESRKFSKGFISKYNKLLNELEKETDEYELSVKTISKGMVLAVIENDDYLKTTYPFLIEKDNIPIGSLRFYMKMIKDLEGF